MGKKIALIAVILLVLIQFFQPEKNISESAQTASIGLHYDVPEEVGGILKKACLDCHSNNTRYPWYSRVQPVAWYLSYHVNDGKEELNFDEFSLYQLKKQDHKLKEVVETVQQGEMPLESYTLIHREAALSPEERQLLIRWAKNLRMKVRQKIAANNLP